MQKLIVKDFSCIKSASIDLKPLSIIIGPQASGKSVISKLIYFFTSVVSELDRYVIIESLAFNDLSRFLSSKFCEWFPSSAWGEKRFVINFYLDGFEVKVARVSKSDKVRVELCSGFCDFYASLQVEIKNNFERGGSDPNQDDFETIWRGREAVRLSLKKWLGESYIENQLFIPAGRSFFTSIGKALVAFENSGILDPVTLDFGRRFSAIRENQQRRNMVLGGAAGSPVGVLFSEILGGTLKFENGKEYIQSKDNRLIPFSALSSGQQELLPLALCIRSMLPSEEPKLKMPAIRSIRRTIYIEEPEAHLFPKAQNRLIEVLAALVTNKKRSNNLLLTTHSPYVLSKFNNLIKAGQLGKRGKVIDHKELASIMPESCWLAPGTVNAYAIVDQRVVSIIDLYGLIDAEYLDDASGDIAEEFNKLLGLEFSRV